jgi:nicotinamide mononucleotide adenylyltransferase
VELSSISIREREQIPAGSVHGRFQPFHNEHLEYVLEAKRRCEFLWIGITKYDVTPTELSPLARLRERPENNPLTYFERINTIADALADAGVGRLSVGFVPFPIETPQRLTAFMPLSVPCFTTICEEWNREKIRVLESCGYVVIVLWERAKKNITGSAIRDDILNGGSAWRSMVPAATSRAIDSFGIRERLSKLRQLSGGGRSSDITGESQL